MVLKFTLPSGVTNPAHVRVGMVPSVGGYEPMPLDEDLNGVFKVTDKDAQGFVVDTFNGSYWSRETYDLSGLTCNAS